MRSGAFFVAIILGWLAGAAGCESSSPRSLGYVLQADQLAPTREQAVRLLAESGRDWLVLAESYGGEGGPWTAAELAGIRSGRPDRKILAYLSVGEAERWRDYWRPEWDADRDGQPDPGAPAYLCAMNPNWPGSYKVRYWQDAWRELVFAQADRLADRGFDGFYLDIVDAFEFFEQADGKIEDHKPNPETGHTYRQDMIALIADLAARERNRTGRRLLIVPQNGVQLTADAAYLALIDGVGVESWRTLPDRPQAAAHTAYVGDFLRNIRAAGKTVLDIEYNSDPAVRAAARAEILAAGYVGLFTDRALTTLGESP